MTTAAIIQLALALLPLVQQGVPQFIAWIESLKHAAQQNDEWTPELDAAHRAALFAKTNDPAYLQDA
jgi:hypothetical protein